MGCGLGSTVYSISYLVNQPHRRSQKSRQPRAGASCEGKGTGGIPGAAAGRRTLKRNAVNPKPQPLIVKSEALQWLPCLETLTAQNPQAPNPKTLKAPGVALARIVC